MDESGTDGAESSKKVVSKKRVAGTMGFLVYARDLQFECARFLHQTLLVLMYVWKQDNVMER